MYGDMKQNEELRLTEYAREQSPFTSSVAIDDNVVRLIISYTLLEISYPPFT